MLGDNTGVNATIDNEKGGVFNIAGDFGISRGAATAKFINAGTLEKTGGANFSIISVGVADTGSIVVATGTLAFFGPQNSFAGPISGAGQIELVGGSTIDRGTTVNVAVFTISNNVVTLNENLSLAHAFNLQNSAILDLTGVTLSVSGTDSFVGSSALEGSGTLITAHGSTTNVNTFFLGGDVTWENFGTVGEVGLLQLGDTTFNPATFINEKGGVFQFAADVGISSGAALDSSFVNDPGALLEKTGGGGSNGSIISVNVTDHGAIIVQTGILDFTGVTNIFAGQISGAGQFEIGGGSNVIGVGAAITTAVFTVNAALVTLGENLTYARTFNIENTALMNLNGFSLNLSGNDTFINNIIDGTGTIVTAARSTVSVNLCTLGGAVTWQNSGTVNEFATLQIGDGSFDVASFTNERGGVFDFVTDFGVAVPIVAQPASSFINSAGAVVEKTGGSGDSQIFVDFTNNGVVKVATGTIEFGTAVAGSGRFIIEPGAVLQFDAALAKGSSVAFATKTGGDLRLLDSQGFGAVITGFGGTKTDEIELKDIIFNSGSFRMSYRGNSTEGVLTVTDGTHSATLDFFGKYTLGNFHASSGPSGGTLITDPGTHAPLLASAR
jgi:hypothetical protein